ncbi:hypothetical protein KR018_008452, partial [Drosophila ironensis]
MKHPLLQRSTQIALLRKQIKHKGQQVKLQKRRAQRRLNLMLRIRALLLRQVLEVINARQADAELGRRERARRMLGGVLRLYRRWLRKWSKSLQLQRKKISQQEQLEQQLNGRLSLLRKQLKKRRRPQHLVDKCFQKLSLAVRKWQKSPDVHPFVKDHDHIWESEAEQVRQYLMDLYVGPAKRRQAWMTRKANLDDSQGTTMSLKKKRGRRKSMGKKKSIIHAFNQFWNSEVLRKKPQTAPSNKGLQQPREVPWNSEVLRKKPQTAPSNKGLQQPREVEAPYTVPAIRNSRKGHIIEANKFNKSGKQFSLSYPKSLLQQMKLINATGRARKLAQYEDTEELNALDVDSNFSSGSPHALFDLARNKEKTISKTEVVEKEKSSTIPGQRRERDKHKGHDVLPKETKKTRPRHKREGDISDDDDDEISLKPGQQPYLVNKRKKGALSKDGEMPFNLEGVSVSTIHLSRKKFKKFKNLTPPFSKFPEIGEEENSSIHSQDGSMADSIGAASMDITLRGKKKRILIKRSKQSKRLSDTGTEIMLRRLKRRKPRYENSPSITSRNQPRDGSITSFSDSIQQMINEDRRRHSRRSVRSLGLPLPPNKYKFSKLRPYDHVNNMFTFKRAKMLASRPSIKMSVYGASGPSNIYHIGQDFRNRIGDLRRQIGYKHRKRASSISSHRVSDKHHSIVSDLLGYSGLPDIENLTIDDRENLETSLRKLGIMELEQPSEKRYELSVMKSDHKFRRIQALLRDVIQQNSVLDYVADVDGLMTIVGASNIWNQLQEMYDNLQDLHIPKGDIKKALSDKYLELLRGIINDMNFVKVVGPLSVGQRPSTNAAGNSVLARLDYLAGKKFWTKPKLSKDHRPVEKVTSFSVSKKLELQTPSRDHSEVMDSAMYKKIIDQELKAERLRREERKRKLRGFGSQTSTSTRSNWELAPSEEDNIRNTEHRYSAKSLKTILNDHRLQFENLKLKRYKGSPVDEPLKHLIEKPRKKLQPQATYLVSDPMKRRRRLRPTEQLYYSPRKTSRQKKICKRSESSECLDCVCQEQVQPRRKPQRKTKEQGKCPRCGVLVSLPSVGSLPQSLESCSDRLSSSSIEACAKNSWLLDALQDVCVRCGFVHNRSRVCPHWPSCPMGTKPLRQLKRATQDHVPRKWPDYCSPGGKYQMAGYCNCSNRPLDP